MNFLAHLYLSGSNTDIRLGNFIGDYVKGKHLDRFPIEVQKGIMLHRAIDSFTDKHNSTHLCIDILRPGYGKYASVVVDVLFDHILANEWKKYSESELIWFTRKFYFQMVQRYSLLPDRVKKFLPFMIQSNRLYSYRTPEGLKRALEIMSSVSSLPENSEYAIDILKEHYSLFSSQFNTLFPEMIEFVKREFEVDFD